MNGRGRVLDAIRVAGYHDDQHARVRLLVESRVSRESADEAWRRGRTQRAAGIPCTCHRCAPQGLE